MEEKIRKTDPERRYRRVLSASSLASDRVRNPAGEDLGKAHDLMIDLHSGRVAYVVLSYGGLLGIGNKLFAVPWNAIKVDEDEKCLILNMDKQRLENAPGFDKDNWPDMADQQWSGRVHEFYGTQPYSEETEQPKTFRGGGGI
ncbi:MAG TPA: PRC-barrel domain-containing protein [Bryobacteraceae bacterium]|nr:PRC-barrel domain-containing protein [Bryobacteraceae bacterium]